jgi:hypothetical protein
MGKGNATYPGSSRAHRSADMPGSMFDNLPGSTHPPSQFYPGKFLETEPSKILPL